MYDFQYIEYLDKKYKYDDQWLKENRSFESKTVIEITKKIKAFHQEKIKKVDFIGLRENGQEFLKRYKRSLPKKSKIKDATKFLNILKFYQYRELFNSPDKIEENFNPETLSNKGWISFYEGLLDIFCIDPKDFKDVLDISSFLNNFSTHADYGVNNQFKTIGDYNTFTSRPIIELSNYKYFVPIVFSVFEAVYESPFYWMMQDKDYCVKLSENRGKVGEEITYELLVKVFGENKVFKSVRIESKKGHNDTDIDVLCILGNKALCVQVKSKKLTQLSRKGSYKQLQLDFQCAVQDAYNQGIISRERILEKSAIFYNEKGHKIDLSEEIDEVYILGITAENYPALTHQTTILLDKEENYPYPLFLTIFDLELVTFYLNNPYEFLYYVRQRIALMEYFNSNEEINFLGYHLTRKLWKEKKAEFVKIDTSFGQLIDRNYCPLKYGIETNSETDRIGNRWKNKDFENLCNQIGDLSSPKTTDIVFHLLDWDEVSKDNLINQIIRTKVQTNIVNSWHNFSMMPGLNKSTFGLTFVSWGNNNPQEMMQILLKLSRARKYKSKADYWIGLGCIKDSSRFVDGFVFNDNIWEYDKLQEEENDELYNGKNTGIPIRFGHKVGRNEPCPCCSGKKYKYCCGA